MTGTIKKLPYTRPSFTQITSAQLLWASRMLFGYGSGNKAAIQHAREKIFLSPHAWPCSKSLGRLISSEEDHRNPYTRDCDRILYMKAYAALAGKTQVVSFPRNPNITNRRFHSEKVASVGRDIGRQLGLNEDLIEAIGKGHDLGHSPFGHDGERTLSELSQIYLNRPFRHNLHSLRVVDIIERQNLTAEVRNGIVCHCGETLNDRLAPSPAPQDLVNLNDNGMPYTLEGCVVRIADIIVYLVHDYQDALRLNLVSASNLPSLVSGTLGQDPGRMLGIMVSDLIKASYGHNYITLSPNMMDVRRVFYNFLKEKIILSNPIQAMAKETKEIVTSLFYYFHKHYDLDAQKAIDHIASLTDKQARTIYRKIIRR